MAPSPLPISVCDSVSASTEAPASTQSSLGNTTTDISRPLLLPSPKSLQTLPYEILLNILANAWQNPVGQMCLALTCRCLYAAFKDTLVEIDKESQKRKYNIAKYPFDLPMQYSVCGKESIYGHSEFRFVLYAYRQINWAPSLGALLSGETGLWRGLTFCSGCNKSKPDTAFERFFFEEEMAIKHERKLETLEVVDFIWYQQHCRRCRAKILYINLDGRLAKDGEEDEDTLEVPTLGLMDLTPSEEDQWTSWEGVFEELGI